MMLLKQVTPQDLVKYGLIPEFVGTTAGHGYAGSVE